ncbi:hypothetical protein [Budvicia aquatica]|uniref:Lipoprotein n=1 Tax=Budvicia aquatica TaxID=82979 RepID=A0A2C6DK95_9GAMM|nr:hypothetical protein [Budvicia aquatica]PHI29184.1 hypothetical protein CRN84_07540 [Budvicia aquatica]VFS47379.1 Uncharacterised protein [Budvicia aquatica]
MNKLSITLLLLVLSGCDSQGSSTTPASVGNFNAKQETLSVSNDSDIKSDLLALNVVMNSANSESLKLREEVTKASRDGDMNAVKEVMKKSGTLQQSVNDKLIALTLRSQEVQAVRIKIIEGNMKAIKMTELVAKQPLSAEDQKELALLGKQSVALQMSTGQQLNQLNSQYGQ